MVQRPAGMPTTTATGFISIEQPGTRHPRLARSAPASTRRRGRRPRFRFARGCVVRPAPSRHLRLRGTLSAPFAGPPRPGRDPWPQIDADLAALQPPRKHYQRYYTAREANADMHTAPRASASSCAPTFTAKVMTPDNRPHSLKSWRAEDLPGSPGYYVMDLDKGMAATAAGTAPSPKKSNVAPGSPTRSFRRMCANRPCRLSGRP